MNENTEQFHPSPKFRHSRLVKYFSARGLYEGRATVELPSLERARVRARESRPPNGPPLPGPAAVHLQRVPLSDQQPSSHADVHFGASWTNWKPGTLGFGERDEDEFEQRLTIPMMVLKEIAAQQNQPVPVMQSEISGAASGAAVVGVGNIAGTVLRYISNLIIQRGFGAGPFGLYSLCLSLVTLISTILTLGLDNAMVRYLAIYRGKQKAHLLKGLIIFCTALAGIAGLLGALLVFALAPLFATLKHSPNAGSLLQLMAPMVPLMIMQVIWASGLQGFKAFKERLLSQRIIPVIALIVLLLASLLFLRNLTGIGLATIISSTIGTVVTLYFFLRKISHITTPEGESYELREWISFSAPNLLTSVVDVVLESVDTLLLAFFAIPNVAIGQYVAALKITNFISVPLMSLNTMFAPTIAELYARGEMQKLTVMFKLVTKWSITLSLPIFAIATLFSVFLLNISGDSFVAAWPLLVALSIGSMGNTATGSVGNMLLMTGHQRLSFLNSLVAFGVNLVLGVILTPRYGAMGTAISTGLAYAVVNLMRLMQVRILLKIHPYTRDVLKPLGAGLISAALIGCVLYLLHYTHFSIRLGHSSIFVQLLLIPVFLTGYIMLLRLFKFSPEDQIVLDSLRKKIARRKK